MYSEGNDFQNTAKIALTTREENDEKTDGLTTTRRNEYPRKVIINKIEDIIFL